MKSQVSEPGVFFLILAVWILWTVFDLHLRLILLASSINFNNPVRLISISGAVVEKHCFVPSVLKYFGVT